MNPTPGSPRLLRSSLALALGWHFLAAAGLAADSVPTTLTQLRERIPARLNQPRFAAASWGCKVVSLDTGATWIELNSGRLFRPASNAKLFTAALALDRLGPDHRIRTSLFATSKPDPAGTIKGDLIVYGRGDPSFAARNRGGEAGQALRPLANALRAAGVRHIDGDLVADETFFRGPPIGSGWAWDDLQHPYAAEVSALTHEDNAIEVFLAPGPRLGAPCTITTRPATHFVDFVNLTTTVRADESRRVELHRPPGENRVTITGCLPLGSRGAAEGIAVHDPGLWFVTELRDELIRMGIPVSGKARRLNPDDAQSDAAHRIEIASVESPPLRDLLPDMLQASRNLEAQLILLQVGAVVKTGQPVLTENTTESAGLDELSRFLSDVHLPGNEVLLDEGSGLSVNSLVSPHAIVELLRVMDQHRHAAIWRASLPVAGRDGTLTNRMKGTRAENNVQAKTGSLRRARALSGYVRTAAGERLVFSLLLNNYEPGAGENADRELDAIAVMLADFPVHPGPLGSGSPSSIR